MPLPLRPRAYLPNKLHPNRKSFPQAPPQDLRGLCPYRCPCLPCPQFFGQARPYLCECLPQGFHRALYALCPLFFERARHSLNKGQRFLRGAFFRQFLKIILHSLFPRRLKFRSLLFRRPLRPLWPHYSLRIHQELLCLPALLHKESYLLSRKPARPHLSSRPLQ